MATPAGPIVVPEMSWRVSKSGWRKDCICAPKPALTRFPSALVNYTARVAQPSTPSHDAERDVALRFLTHLMGDAHQPLHLTGRARGGNDIQVRFEGRQAKLHTVWDSQLLNTQIRELSNYTTKLSSSRIESALQGRNYDAYIRWILAEGMGQGTDKPGWWAQEALQWATCPDSRVENRASPETPSSSAGAHWLRSVSPNTARLARQILASFSTKAAKELKKHTSSIGSAIDDTDLPICPFAWTKPLHPLVCEYAFASPVPRQNNTHPDPPPELDVAEYRGRIEDDKIIQKQLAMAGFRLAAVLNSVLLNEALAMEGSDDGDLLLLAPDQFVLVDSLAPRAQGQLSSLAKKRHKSAQSPIMSLVTVTLESIAEVIILSTVGYVLARQGVLDKKTQTKINRLNVSFFTPALLFSKVAFTLDPGRLAELLIVPFGFVIVTLVSAFSAFLLSYIARLSKAHRKFSLACAITPNSNSLPVALMQSLVVTVPQLHWEEEGEPEDTVNGMLGRALTYLVLFSTLGMFLRWSLAAKLLASVDDEVHDDSIHRAESARDWDTPTSRPATGRLIDYEDDSPGLEAPSKIARRPEINIRRPTEEGSGLDPVAPTSLTGETLPEGPAGRRPSKSRQGPPAWVRSFPNSPTASSEDSEPDSQAMLSDAEEQRRNRMSAIKQSFRAIVVRPWKAFTGFMTMPLYAAVMSLVVAMLPPLQKAVGSIEPLVGALETAGACSIPLTMVVLGAYFHEETDNQTLQRQQQHPHDQDQIENGAARNTTDSNASTLVSGATGAHKRRSFPWMKNPWSSGASSETSSDTGGGQQHWSYDESVANASEAGDHEEEQHQEAQRNARVNSLPSSNGWLGALRRRDSALTHEEVRARKKRSMERRTIIVAVASRMILTPLILLPVVAWYAIATRCEFGHPLLVKHVAYSASFFYCFIQKDNVLVVASWFSLWLRTY